MAATKAPGIVDPTIFEQLQADIDDDSHVREEIRNILQKRERQGTANGISILGVTDDW